MDELPPLPELATIQDRVDAHKTQASAWQKLGRQLEAVKPEALARAVEELEATGVEHACLDDLHAWLAAERLTRRKRLAKGIRTLADAAGLEAVVLTRDPIELRIPPVSMSIDTEADKVDICFGREVVATSRADAALAMEARAEAVAVLERGEWDAAAFHQDLRLAWKRGGARDWMELADVLPELALIRQPKRFRQNPSARNFVPYPRVQLAYDLWRLRRDRSLEVEGWRLSLGSATGGSTRDKKRVFWLEDDRGRGQYHLTLRFVQEA
jgi:hypothetical protein